MRKSIALLLILSFSCFSYGKVMRCTDKNGKSIFTDNIRLCESHPKEVELKTQNTFSSSDKSLPEINYRVPQRSYINESGNWNVFYEKDLFEKNPKLYSKAKNRLNAVLNHIDSALPQSSISKLKSVNIYVMWGEVSPLGGEKSGMRYVRNGEPQNQLRFDPRWDNSLIINSAQNLVYLSDLWARKAIVHELAHAWHLLNWHEKHPSILNPWEESQARGLYKNVKDINGNVIHAAYARTNNLEYFSELSAIYFVGGNYYPFNKSELSVYDSQGYNMVEALWNVK